METGGSMTHSQGLSNNPYTIYLVLKFISLRSVLIFYLSMGHPGGLLPSYILATFPVQLNLLDVITLTISGERNKL